MAKAKPVDFSVEELKSSEDAVLRFVQALEDDSRLDRQVKGLRKLAEAGPAAKAAGPFLFGWACSRKKKDPRPVAARHALEAMFGLKYVDINYETFQSYGDFIEFVRKHGRLVETPTDTAYQEKANDAERRMRAFRQQLAAELAPALNDHIQYIAHDTYEEKKALTRWLNEELRRFDLAIKGPTGQPSILLAEQGNHPEVGRFMLEHKSPEGKRVRNSFTPRLPHLELMEANPRREAIIEWREKVGRDRKGASRA